ncbi:MAG: hypothetical protein ACREKM_11930 [Longimicrobiales bacterium]
MPADDAAAAAADAAASSQPSYATSDDADIAEIQDYELTMDDIRMWSAATAELQRVVEANPQLAASLEEEESGGQDLDDSIDAMAERYDSEPAVRDAIEDAGLSAREYTVIFWAMMQAGMAQFSIEQGANPEEVARDLQVNPANIEFVQEHEAEIAALREQLQGGSNAN